MKESDAIKMLADYVFRVARWSPDFDPRPLYEAFGAVRNGIGKIPVLERDLADQARQIAILGEQSARLKAAYIALIVEERRSLALKEDHPFFGTPLEKAARGVAEKKLTNVLAGGT